jgi:HK97 family phage portal protein
MASHAPVRIGRITWKAQGAPAESGIIYPEPWFSDWLGGSPTAAGIRVDPLTAMRCSVVHAAVRRIANDVARTPLHLWRKKSATGSRMKAKDHRIHNRITRRPAPFHNRYTWMRQLVVSYLLFGSAYILPRYDERISPRRVASVPALFPLMGNTVRLRTYGLYNAVAEISTLSEFESVMLGADQLRVPYSDILHIPNLRLNGPEGISIPMAAREAIASHLIMEGFGSAFFSRGARPSGVIRLKKKLSPEAQQRIHEMWNRTYGGVENTGKTAILEEGHEYEPISSSGKDTQLYEMRKFAVEEVCRHFNIPPHKVGDFSQAKWANVEQADLDYINGTLSAIYDSFEAAFDEHFLTDGEAVNMGWDFDPEGLIRAEVSTRAANYLKLKLGGVMTTNEVRERLGLDPIEGGDKIMQPLNTGQPGGDPGQTSDGDRGASDEGRKPGRGNGADPEARGFDHITTEAVGHA